MILDSGERRKYDTGAVRDIQEGKGRCDLLPLVVASRVLTEGEIYDEVLFLIDKFMNTMETQYLIEALHSFCKKTFEYPETMLLEVSKHFEEGAKKYGENNWQKGLPYSCYIDSAVRHYLKAHRGDQDENHERAFVWNLLCCIWEVDHHENRTV